MNPTSGLPLYDASALQRWKSATLPADPESALLEEAVAASSRAELLREKVKLGGSDEISAIRNQAQQLKADFLEEARTPERVSQVNLQDSQLAFRAALAGLMVGALEGALACAGQEVCAPIPIPAKDQWGAQEFGSKAFSQPAEKVAQDQRETPLPPSTQKTLELLDNGLKGGYGRATRMCYLTHAEGMQTCFEAAHSRVVKGLTASSPALTSPTQPLPGESLPAGPC